MRISDWSSDVCSSDLEAEHVLDRVEQPVRETAFLGPVLLGLDDIDAARATVSERAETLEVVERTEAGDDGIAQAFGGFGAVRQLDHRRRHQMTDVAHEHHAAAVERERISRRRSPFAVGRHRSEEQTSELQSLMRI